MGVNVTVDEKLVEEAKRISGLSSESAAVEHVLQRLLAGPAKLKSMFDLVGKVQLRDDYDYKAMRVGKSDLDR